MLSFQFRVNRSFLEYPTHPVTIPRSQVDYGMVESMLAGGPRVDLQVADDPATPAQIYGASAGFGPYYQIRAESALALDQPGFELGDKLLVTLDRSERSVHVRLAPCP